jgi:hypothetical protein
VQTDQPAAEASPTPRSGPAAGRIDWAFALLLALVSAAIAYRYGVGNQEEHIPIILRQLDPNYLPRDFYVATSVEFGPRFYFARFVAAIARPISLPWAFVGLRFASDLALAVVTLWTARRLIGADRLGAMMAAVLALTVSGFHLGDATELRYSVFQPATVAIPGMLFAIGLGMCGRPIASAVVASVTSLCHPLYGIYGGAFGLASAFVALLIPIGTSRPIGRGQPLAPGLEWRRAVAPTGAAAAIFGVSMLIFWWWPFQASQADRLSTEELFAILGRFRSPHHYFPSTFRLQDYAATLLFVTAGALAFERWSAGVSRRTATVMLVPILGVVLGCTAGTLCTEVWPSRIVLTLQLFRLLSVLKWTGYLLIGWLLANHWHTPPNAFARPVVCLALLSPGGTFPVTAATGLAAVRLYPWLAARVSPVLWISVLAVGAAALWIRVDSVEPVARLLVALGILTALNQADRRIRAVVSAVAVVVVLWIVSNRPGGASDGSTPFKPIFSAAELRGPDADAARTAAVVTPPDAVFVAPPGFGILRIAGPRALVVEFEAIPYQDVHMRAWRERIRRVYGEVHTSGHDARLALDEAYHRIADSHLLELATAYGVTHAVLYADTPTALTVLYGNDRYRIVSVREP